ncbi:MAG: ATP cone domain-containing protein, partial [Gemmataceae bacterium]
MNDSSNDSSAAPPAWVHKRDGQLAPFDADKISRALFAAGEELGRTDAFLARELTDGVVHFLSQESEEATPTTQQISELVIKVVRELGQPALAEAFARHAEQRSRSHDKPEAAKSDSGAEIVLRFQTDTPLPDVLSGCARQYALQAVFARDLTSAQSEGVLTLTGLVAPEELSGCVLRPPLDPAGGLLIALEELRRFVHGFVVLDGPEHLLAEQRQTSVDNFVRDVAMGLRLTGLRGIVNLNCAAPPSWAGELAEGPLFAAQRRVPLAEQLRSLA